MNIFTSYLKRFWWIMLLVGVVAAAGVMVYQETTNAKEYKSLLFITVGIDETKMREGQDVDHYGIAEGGDRFTETLIGWFRNPALHDAVETEAGLQEPSGFTANLGVSKQEYQNLIVDYTVQNEVAAHKIQESLITVLEDKLNTFNTNNRSGYTLTIDKGAIAEMDMTSRKDILFAFLLGIILTFGVLYFIEFLRGVVTDRSDAMRLTESEITFDGIGDTNVRALATFLGGQEGLCILGGANCVPEKTTYAIAKHIATMLHNDVTLVDTDLTNRTLHQVVGLSDTMDKVKGATDLDTIKSKESFYLLEQGRSAKLQFIPAGNGESILDEFIHSLSESTNTVLLSTRFPENPEILTLGDAVLCVYVKVGTTKRKTLELLRKLWEGDIVLIFV